MANTAKISVIRWFRATCLFGLIGQLSFVARNGWHETGARGPKVLRRAEAVEDFSELLKFMERAQLGDFQSKVLDWCQELELKSTQALFLVIF